MRNILLADDNIVKICDFGLSKSMYNADNYLKKGAVSIFKKFYTVPLFNCSKSKVLFPTCWSLVCILLVQNMIRSVLSFFIEWVFVLIVTEVMIFNSRCHCHSGLVEKKDDLKPNQLAFPKIHSQKSMNFKVTIVLILYRENFRSNGWLQNQYATEYFQLSLMFGLSESLFGKCLLLPKLLTQVFFFSLYFYV